MDSALNIARGSTNLVLRGNRFENLSGGCIAIAAEGGSIDFGAERFTGNSVDIDVCSSHVLDAQSVVAWSNADPCTGITLVAGATLRHANGLCQSVLRPVVRRRLNVGPDRKRRRPR